MENIIHPLLSGGGLNHRDMTLECVKLLIEREREIYYSSGINFFFPMRPVKKKMYKWNKQSQPSDPVFVVFKLTYLKNFRMSSIIFNVNLLQPYQINILHNNVKYFLNNSYTKKKRNRVACGKPSRYISLFRAWSGMNIVFGSQ